MKLNCKTNHKLALWLCLLMIFFGLDQGRLNAADQPIYLLSTSGGIAAPSVQSALGENPAGLVYNGAAKFDAVGVRGTTSKTLGAGGFFFHGNETVGGGISIQGFNSQSDSPGRVGLLNYGIATLIPNLNVAFGFNGTTRLFKMGEVSGTGTGTTWCVDSGMIWNPKGKTRLGLSVFQILAGVDAVGAGLAQELVPSTLFVLDTVKTIGNSNILLKPGLRFALDQFQMTISYGQRIGHGWTWATQGLTAGAGVFLGSNFRLYGYINHFARALVGLTYYL